MSEHARVSACTHHVFYTLARKDSSKSTSGHFGPEAAHKREDLEEMPEKITICSGKSQSVQSEEFPEHPGPRTIQTSARLSTQSAGATMGQRLPWSRKVF